MLSKIKAWFLTKFGDIKYYKYPFWLVYCPTTYKIKGDDYLDVHSKIKIGDILLRGYDDYLDGLFIPGDYSHAGIYMGLNKVAHAVAQGVSYQNLIDFMRCDRLMILRPKNFDVISSGIELCMKAIKDKVPYDFDFTDNNAYYCFELVAQAYKVFNIQKLQVKRFLGLYNKMLYVADSLLNCDQLEKVYENNPKREIYYNVGN